jgi:hypothetical protein
MLLWRRWWLYQAPNAASHAQACWMLCNGLRGQSGPYFTVWKTIPSMGLSLLTLGLEKDLSTPSSSCRLSSVVARNRCAEDARIVVNPLEDRFADAERLQRPVLNPPSSSSQWGSGWAARREPEASDPRAFQASLVRTGGLPSGIR